MAAGTSTLDSLTGRRGVDIGTSFTRAWNERTGKTTKRSKGYPNPEYYSLRYKFKPESIDDEGTGTLTPKPGGDGHVFELERPSQQGDSHCFTAIEQPSKEWECVLLWDPTTQQLTLEKLESTLNLNYDGRGKGKRPASETPPSSTPGPSRAKRPNNTTSAAAARDRELEDDLEKALTGYSDAEGEPDDEAEEILRDSAKREEEEEEEEEEMEPVDVEPPPPPPPPVKPKAAPPKNTPKAKPKGRARPSASTKKEVDDVEEEELYFGEPTTKRTRTPRRASTSGNSLNNTGLALPALPPQNRHAPLTPSDLLQPPSTTRMTYAGSDSGSESEESDDAGHDVEEGLDAAALERELELELAEVDADEDEGMEAIPIENGQHDSGRPLSLNELFGEQSQGDDDSSSDDSDDD